MTDEILAGLENLRRLQFGRPWYRETGAQGSGLSAGPPGHDTITPTNESEND